tara:strand:- start:260 stop:439 length:180 start_codon:yes stop_codon:yes gene_type:complete
MIEDKIQIATNEIRDSRNDMKRIRRKLETLEVAIWANIFFSFVIILAIAILIVNGSSNG